MNSNDKKRLIEDYFKKVCELLKNKLQEKEFSTNWEVHLLPYIGRPYYKPITIRHKNKASKDYNHTVTFEFNHSKGLLYNGMYGIIANNNKFHEYHGYRGDIIYDEHYPDIYENAQKKFKYQKHKAAQCWPLFIDFYNNKCWLDDDLIEKLHTFYEKEEKSELFKETEAMVSNMLTMVEVLDDILKWNNDSLCAQIHQYAAEQSLNLYTLEKEINYYLHELIYVENNVCTIVFLNRGTKERLGELVGYAREALQMPVELLYAKDIQEGRSLHQPIPLVEGYSEDFEELYNLLLDGDKTKLFIISGEAAIHCECDKNKNICYLNFLYTDTEDDNYVKIEYDDFTFGRFI
ncbi:MAG: hypothetical protein LBV04_10310, partial [Deferribacteraceae bacterium]|nr:hypothetical protein [Deferribacteraceae bacterium]